MARLGDGDLAIGDLAERAAVLARDRVHSCSASNGACVMKCWNA
jgi:hypothetical protein